jgi:hypothetical protein
VIAKRRSNSAAVKLIRKITVTVSIVSIYIIENRFDNLGGTFIHGLPLMMAGRPRWSQ